MRPLLAALCAATLLAAPAHAGSRPATVTDPKGDWAVAGQDLVRARLYSVTAGTRALRADVELADVPVTGTTYAVQLGNEASCESWALVVTFYGTPEQSASLQHFPCSVTGLPGSDASIAATFAVTGKTLRLTAPYGLGLRRGTRLTYGGASAATYFLGLFVGPPANQDVLTGDIAMNGIDYVLT
jgi:hypothetical protein